MEGMSGRFVSGIGDKGYAHYSIQHPFMSGCLKKFLNELLWLAYFFNHIQSTVNFLLWLHAVLVIVLCNKPNDCIGFAKCFQYQYWKSPKLDIGMSDYYYWLQYRLIAFMIIWCRMLPSCTLVLAKIRVRLLLMRTLIFGIWFSPHHLSYANHWFVLCTFSIENQTLKEVCSLYRHSAQQLNHFILLC